MYLCKFDISEDIPPNFSLNVKEINVVRHSVM